MRYVRTTGVLALVSLLIVPVSPISAQCVDPPVIHWVGTNTREGPGRVGGSSRNEVSFDDAGNAYLAGGYWDEDGPPVDLDPTDGVDLHLDRGDGLYTTDIFATRVHPDGYMVWTQTAGDEQKECAMATALDSHGDFVYAGYFHTLRDPPYRVDFDPTPGTDIHVLNGTSEDAFVSKLRPDGSYRWTRTFGTSANAYTAALGVAITPLDEVVLTGNFQDTVDFDPGPGEDPRPVAGDTDVFVLKLDSDGLYVWVGTFGGPDAFAIGHDTAVDDLGNILIMGRFSGTVDFDPARESIGTPPPITRPTSSSLSCTRTGPTAGREPCPSKSAACVSELSLMATGALWSRASLRGRSTSTPHKVWTSTPQTGEWTPLSVCGQWTATIFGRIRSADGERNTPRPSLTSTAAFSSPDAFRSESTSIRARASTNAAPADRRMPFFPGGRPTAITSGRSPSAAKAMREPMSGTQPSIRGVMSGLRGNSARRWTSTPARA